MKRNTVKKDPKHTIYFIGGPARSGKTTVAERIMRRKHFVVVSTDVIRAAVRKVLIGESRVSIEEINFKGKAVFRRPGDLKVHKVTFEKSPKESEDALAWVGTLGIIETYDRKNNVDVLIEGIAVTPERVSKLKLKNMAIKAVFIGYGDKSHTAAILEHARKKEDWVHTWIKEHGGDDSRVEDWVRKGVARSKVVEKLAKKFGYGYFDITKRPFKEQVQAIADYLLLN